jgi:hypothetical protein
MGLLGCGLLIPAAGAQAYPLKIEDRALENAYVLHARNWPPTLGLPNSVIMRTNAGERWFQIETARDTFSPTFGNLFLPDTGWVATAQKYHTDLIYTFNTVPAWAVHNSGGDPANVAPYDIDAKSERCEGPLSGQVSADGNCIWKEWISALMQKNCNVKAQPAQSLNGRCQIRYFEAWNEFNAGLVSSIWQRWPMTWRSSYGITAAIVRSSADQLRRVALAGAGTDRVALAALKSHWESFLMHGMRFQMRPCRTS